MFNAQADRNPSLPALFVPHGAPTFVLQPGAAGAVLHGLGRQLRRPKAVLVVSAHWDTAMPTLGLAPRPDTLHDFYGFPRALYTMRYPAPGAIALTMDARSLLEDAGFEVALDPRRGLDHGVWVPLKLMYPDADVPVLTMSVQSHLGPGHHFRLGRALSPLREVGVLVVGSGNLTHNLGHFGAGAPPHYVSSFQDWVQQKLAASDVESMLHYRSMAPGAVEAHPTDEHLLPLYVAMGAAGSAFAAQRLYDGIEHSMLAMDSYAFWPALTPNQGGPELS
jgi:4,5-DOPA dioxygenase extradiol